MPELESREVAEAAAWIARLRAPDANRLDHARFSAWLQEPRHQREFDRQLALWESLQLQDHPLATAPLSQSHRWPALHAAWVSVAILLPLFLVALQGLPARFFTGVGHQQIVMLPDGSTLHLNTNTAVEWRAGPGGRDLFVPHGEIFIEVAKDPSRPLRVRTPNGAATAVGTAFGVRVNERASDVFVRQGRVVVDTGDSREEISAGAERALSKEGIAASELTQHDALSWVDGNLIYNNVPLSLLITDLNRYMQVPMVLSPELQGSSQRVTAVIRLQDQRGTLMALKDLLRLDSRLEANGTITLFLRAGA